MHAFEVRELRLIPCLDERLEAGLHERRDAAAEHRLLAEEIRLRLFREGGEQHARTRASDRLRVRERIGERVPRRIHVHRNERGHSAAVLVHLAHAMARRLGRDHAHIDTRGRDDLVVANVEAVREHQRLPRGEMRRDVAIVDLLLRRVTRENEDEVRLLRRVGNAQHLQPRRLRLRLALRAIVQPHHHVHAAVLQVERVRVTLAAEADDGDRLALELREVGVAVVVHLRHVFSTIVIVSSYR